MLTLYDFQTLNDNEKAEAVWQGSFLGDRQENGQMIQLYSLASFYVEVSYSPTDNRITGFEAFTNTQRLVPYLAQIKFSSR
ncbi:MAG TPA: hypothetical protein VJ844_04140 [Mucilaginibacter sp.]|nr:hypothetical protein [Mucilaginibacter sp.]